MKLPPKLFGLCEFKKAISSWKTGAMDQWMTTALHRMHLDCDGNLKFANE